MNTRAFGTHFHRPMQIANDITTLISTNNKLLRYEVIILSMSNSNGQAQTSSVTFDASHALCLIANDCVKLFSVVGNYPT